MGLFFRKNVCSTSLLVVMTWYFVSFALQDTSTITDVSEQVTADSLLVGASKISEKSDPVKVDDTQNTDTVKFTNFKASSGEKTLIRNSKKTIVKPLAKPTPVIYTRVPRKGQIITGSALFGVSYGLAMFVAVASSNDNSYGSGSNSGVNTGSYFAIPIIGPIVADIVDPPEAEISGPINLMCIGWTAAQSIGLFLLIKGIVGDRHQTATSDIPLNIAPYAMSDKVGINVSFRFSPN
jgi:hypothetical protein